MENRGDQRAERANEAENAHEPYGLHELVTELGSGLRVDCCGFGTLILESSKASGFWVDAVGFNLLTCISDLYSTCYPVQNGVVNIQQKFAGI